MASAGVWSAAATAAGLFPGRTRFVLHGWGRDYGRNGERFAVLMTFDQATSNPQALRLDLRRTPQRVDWRDRFSLDRDPLALDGRCQRARTPDRPLSALDRPLSAA